MKKTQNAIMLALVIGLTGFSRQSLAVVPTLYVTNGASFGITSGTNNSYANTYVGYTNTLDSNNSLTVANSNTLLTNSGSLYVGNAGSSNSLVISNGAKVVDVYGFIGRLASSSNNAALVTGSGSLWTNSARIYLGYSGSGTLTVANGGTVIGNAIEINHNSTLNIGSLNGSDAAGIVIGRYYGITIDSGGGTVNFNQTNSVIISAGISDSGTGVLNQLGSGTTILTGDASSFSGRTMVSAGTLLANNSSSSLGTGTVTVNSGGTLGGNGLIAGPATITSGGALVAGYSSSGTLTFTNSLTLASGSSTTFLINGTNNFTSITLSGGLIHYGGVLTFNLSNYTPSTGDTFTLFNLTNGASQFGDFTSVVTLGGDPVTLTDSGGIWSGVGTNGFLYQFSGSSGQLSVQSVPEPSLWGLLGLGALLSLMFIRWKSGKAA